MSMFQSIIELKDSPTHGQRWAGNLYNFDGKFICRGVGLDVPPQISLSKTLVLQPKFPRPDSFDHTQLRKLPSFTLTISPEEQDPIEWNNMLSLLKRHNRMSVFFCDAYHIAALLTSPKATVLTVFCADSSRGLPYLLNPRQGTPTAPIAPTVPTAPRPGIHPRYLDSVVHTHSSWVFGGMAELIDNSRDAGTSLLDVFVAFGHPKGEIQRVPMLCFRDNGKGMTHSEMVTLLSFGHKAPSQEESQKIGRFGVGFKTGALRIGTEVVVLTQARVEETKIYSRSIGFLSMAYNEGKDVLETPILTFQGESPDKVKLDESTMTKDEAEAVLNSISKLSPLDKSRISEEFENLGRGGASTAGEFPTGTVVFIVGLRKEKGEYELDWETNPKDILVRSRRARRRPGQMSVDVPLDYSLARYLQFLFINPQMSIRVQNERINPEVLTHQFGFPRYVAEATILGQPVKLNMGFIESEREAARCGIFLYWHDRLIEAYKRVGRMIHDIDCGLGVIGVVDVSSLMDNGLPGKVGVLNSKQGFEDSEAYADLDAWLAKEFHQYWDKYFDKFKVDEDKISNVGPGVEFTELQATVQCDKCRKWRNLPKNVTAQQLPDIWFCWMEPFKKGCSAPEEIADGDDLVTLQITREKDVTLPLIGFQPPVNGPITGWDEPETPMPSYPNVARDWSTTPAVPPVGDGDDDEDNQVTWRRPTRDPRKFGRGNHGNVSEGNGRSKRGRSK